MIQIKRSISDKKRFVLIVGKLIFHMSLKETTEIFNKLKRFKEFKGEII